MKKQLQLNNGDKTLAKVKIMYFVNLIRFQIEKFSQ